MANWNLEYTNSYYQMTNDDRFLSAASESTKHDRHTSEYRLEKGRYEVVLVVDVGETRGGGQGGKKDHRNEARRILEVTFANRFICRDFYDLFNCGSSLFRFFSFLFIEGKLLCHFWG